MELLKAIKTQSLAPISEKLGIGCGALSFSLSVLLHVAVAGGTTMLLYTFDKISAGKGELDQPAIFVTMVQENTVQKAVPETVKKQKIEQKKKTDLQKIKINKSQGTVPLPQAEKEKKQVSQKLQNNPVAEKVAGAGKSATLYYGGTGQAEVRYQDQVRAILNANRLYPRQARRLKQEGQAIIQLEITRDGEIKSHHFIQSTGHHILDQAVKDMVAQSNPLPKVPETIRAMPVKITVPVGFELKK